MVGSAARSSRPDIGGAWSSYWYNDFIYETNITEGLNIFEYTGPQVRGNFNLALPEPADAGVHDQGQGQASAAEPGLTRCSRGRPSGAALVLDVT